MNQTQQPLVSIIMPVYNTEPYLREALDSILRQTYSHFELIIVNDGSTDGSAEIIDQYAAKDSRIQVFHRRNTGVVAAANFAASHAQGTYIMRTDSDDVSFDNKLADLVRCSLDNSHACLVTGNIEVIDNRSEYLYRHVLPPRNEEIKRAMLLYNPIANGATMIRKEVFDEVGGYSDVFAEDFHLWVKLFNKGDFVATDSPLYRWRVNPDGLTFSNNKLSIEKEKEYTNILWKNNNPSLLSRGEVMDRSNYYYTKHKKYGVEYKKIFLFDLARLSIHQIKRGQYIDGVRQLAIIASTGRTGLKVVFHRFALIIKGAHGATLRATRTRTQDIDNADPTLLR